MVKKILKYNGTEYPQITHDDREKKNLNFKVVHLKGEQFIVVEGEESNISDYLSTNLDISLSSVNNIAALVSKEFAEITCQTCKGTGKVPNPLYQLDTKI